MIDIKSNEIEALEIETARLNNVLQSLLESTDLDPFVLRRELERARYQLQQLMSMARKLHEQNEIAKNHTDHIAVDFWSRPPSTI